MRKPVAGEKIPILYTMELHFNHEGKLKKWTVANQSGQEVMNFRLTVFDSGFNLQITPTHSEIIFPRDLVRIYIDMQKGWHE